jgi:flavin reductase (DIM6/NTAB) family NADH-FMN oxidoreductase RutF
MEKSMNVHDGVQNASADACKALFRDLSNGWARGVAVVTTVDPGGLPYGLTMRAVSPVSATPLRFMICVGETSRSLKAILSAQAFCINYLSSSQQAVAEHFASRLDDKFADAKCSRLPSGSMMVDGATGVIECSLAHMISSGDHRLLIGDVTSARVFGGDPLMFFDGRYQNLMPV